MIFPKMMAAGKAETVDFKRKEVPEMLREKIRKKLKSEQGTSIFFGYQCGTGVKRFYYQYKAVRNCYSKKR